LLNTSTPSNNQPSLFFGDCKVPSQAIGELEEHLGEQLDIFEAYIEEEEEETIPHTTP